MAPHVQFHWRENPLPGMQMMCGCTRSIHCGECPEQGCRELPPPAFGFALFWEVYKALIRLASTRVVGYSSWRRDAHEDGASPAAGFALCSVAGFPYAGDSADRGWEAEPGGSRTQNARRQTGFVRDLEA